MTKAQSITILSLFVLIPLAYIILNESNSTVKVIKIPQLMIEPKKNIEQLKDVKEEIKNEEPATILSKLKLAVNSSKKRSEKEEAQEILKTLKKSTIKANKKQIPIKIVASIKKNSTKRKVIKVVIAKKNATEKSTLKKATLKIDPIAKATTRKNFKHNKTIAKRSTIKKLTREEEVALYNKQHEKGLEVLNVSETFEINQPSHVRPDSEYFEPIKQTIEKNNANPTKFVETLGVVGISQQYEVSNVEIPKKIELAKEGIVDIASASVETEELKALDFIEPLEIVEVSPTFETTEAEKFIK